MTKILWDNIKQDIKVFEQYKTCTLNVYEWEAIKDLVDAALSVCSEEGVRENLLSYTQGVKLLDALDRFRR